MATTELPQLARIKIFKVLGQYSTIVLQTDTLKPVSVGYTEAWNLFNHYG